MIFPHRITGSLWPTFNPCSIRLSYSQANIYHYALQ